MPEFNRLSCPFNNSPNAQCLSVCSCTQCKYREALGGAEFKEHCRSCASIHLGGMCNFVQGVQHVYKEDRHG